MNEFSIKVSRTARYFTLGTPNPKLKRVWFICHGYGHLASYFIRHFEALSHEENLVVVPEALSRFYLNGFSGRVGASWMTKEDRLHEIDDYINYLDKVAARVLADIDKALVSIIAFGFSQGTAAVSRWVSFGKIQPNQLVLWAGSLPPELGAEDKLIKLRKMKLTLVYGTGDEFATSEGISEQTRFLNRHKMNHELIPFEGGHELNQKIILKIAQSV